MNREQVKNTGFVLPFISFVLLHSGIANATDTPSTATKVNAVSAVSAKCYPDVKTVTLTGTLKEQTFAGPPNYESVANGDEPETEFLMVFASPICTSGDEDEKDAFDQPNPKVDSIQLVFLEEADYLYKNLRPYIGKEIECTGMLFDAETGHHHTPVLLQVLGKNCKPINH